MRTSVITVFALAILMFLGTFTATAFAASAVPTDGSAVDYGKLVIDAVLHGQYWFAGSLGVVLLCAAAKKYMPASWQVGTKGDIAGTALAFVMAGALSMASAFAVPGAVFSVAMLGTAAKIGLGAVGGYNILHKLLGWAADWKAMPAWLAPILKLLSSLVGSDAIAKAQKAGDDAVAAKPATGLAEGAQVKEIE